MNSKISSLLIHSFESQSDAILPKCLVLLATHNGECWLSQQLSTIFGQANVCVKVSVSDDKSVDRTKDILSEWESAADLTRLPYANIELQSANNNFMRLIRDVNIGNAEYIALADQDDIWYPDKLSRAISVIKNCDASAYSSNVEAFWQNGKTKVIKKSYIQKGFDYLFESPGPGCTFVFTRKLFLEIQEWVTSNFNNLLGMWVHDWTLYAFARSSGHRWVIDDFVSMGYRQHGANEIGANSGILAIVARVKRFWSGKYREDLLWVYGLVGAPQRLELAVKRLWIRDRLWLIFHAYQFRRSTKAFFAICVLFTLMRK